MHMAATAPLKWSERSLARAASVACTLGTIIVVAWFFWTAPLPRPIANDSIFEFRDWMHGVSLWDMLRHNGAPSWFASLGLYLDTEVGPYPLWSYVIGYAGFAFFVSCFAAVSRSRLGDPLTVLFCAIVLLLWFSVLNIAQAYGYIWRVTESGAQLSALGAGMLAIRFLDQARPVRTFGLIALAFVFSNIHAGYVIFLALMLVLVLVDKAPARRISYVVILGLYVAYMILWDGTFGTLTAKFVQGGGGDRPLTHVLTAVLGLQTQVARNIVDNLGLEALAGIARTLFLGVVVVSMCVAVVRAWSSQDTESGVFLYLAVSQVGIALLAVLGRIGAFGTEVMFFERYASYSLTLFYAVLWYGVINVSRRVALVILLVTAAVALLLVEPTLRKVTNVAIWFDQKMSMIYSVALRQEVRPLQDMRLREQEAFLDFVIRGLEDRGAAGFGQKPWGMIGALKPASQSLPRCDGAIKTMSQTEPDGYAVWEYVGPSRPAKPADVGFVLSEAGKPIALSRPTTTWTRSSMRLYVPWDVAGAIFYLAAFGDAGSTKPDVFCSLTLATD